MLMLNDNADRDCYYDYQLFEELCFSLLDRVEQMVRAAASFPIGWIREEVRFSDLVFFVNRMTSNSNSYLLFGRPIPETVDALGKRFAMFSQRLNEKLDVSGTVSSIKMCACDHPVFAFVLVAMATVCAIPILAFISFVVATLGFTFMGFLFVEGTLLTVGTFLLSGALFVIGFLALGFSAFVAATWFFVNKAFNLLSAASDKMSLRSKQKPPALVNGLHNCD